MGELNVVNRARCVRADQPRGDELDRFRRDAERPVKLDFSGEHDMCVSDASGEHDLVDLKVRRAVASRVPTLLQ